MGKKNLRAIEETMKVCDEMINSKAVKEALTLEESAKMKLFSAYFVNSIMCRIRPIIACLRPEEFSDAMRHVTPRVMKYADKAM